PRQNSMERWVLATRFHGPPPITLSARSYIHAHLDLLAHDDPQVSRRLNPPERHAAESRNVPLVDRNGDDVAAQEPAVELLRILLRHFDVVWFQSALGKWPELTFDFVHDLVDREMVG